ncbi:MAG TPA: itaconyl-CoA hydratase [Burkholderiaceae bacterium]|nr:itaconyl-CoA hydratase [Burkholderiaceae bacterium]
MTNQVYPEWIGRKETYPDNLDPGHVRQIALALNQPAPMAGEALPHLWIWAHFVRGQAYEELGRDGHPAKGSLLPPVGTRNRMWAGGRVRFIEPLLVGTPAERQSTIIKISEKTGRTGTLVFFTVQHDYLQEGRLCITEEQDIVYRDPTPPKLEGNTPAAQGQWSATVEPSTIMLFRYSAVTFNGHRIHYDLDYVTKQEGYPGLVVHGPLIATNMLQACIDANPGREVETFNYRGLRPLIAPKPFEVAGTLNEDGSARLWAQQDGTLAHQAELTFK